MNSVYDYYITPEEYAIAEKNGISYDTLNGGIRVYGWNKQRAITQPVKKQKKTTNHGSYPKQAEENGIPRSTYYSRIRAGMSKREASTKSVRCNRKWAEKMRSKIKRKYPNWVYDNLEKNGINLGTFYYRVNKLG